jgi:hypothetical protein
MERKKCNCQYQLPEFWPIKACKKNARDWGEDPQERCPWKEVGVDLGVLPPLSPDQWPDGLKKRPSDKVLCCTSGEFEETYPSIDKVVKTPAAYYWAHFLPAWNGVNGCGARMSSPEWRPLLEKRS